MSVATVSPGGVHADDVQRAGRVYGRLLRYAIPYWRMYLIGILGMGMYAITDLFWATFARDFVQYADKPALGPHLLAYAAYAPLAVIAIFLVRGVGDYLGTYFPGWVGRQVITVIRGDLFSRYLRLPTARYDRESTSGMLTRLIYNAELVASAGTSSLTTLIRDSMMIAVDVGLMVHYNWRLALFALIAAPAIAWLIRNVNIRFRRYGTRIQNSMGDVTRVAKEALD
ncbi:MAG: ABC transporter transmembrane domain-containing protein, partial [Steroidobacteraceae bacterium]